MNIFSQSSRYAIKITSTYLIIASIWIFLSDHALKYMITDPQFLRQAQTYKGWIFVLVTSIILFYLVANSASSLIENRDRIKQALQERKVLITELHHRVKNNLAVICGLIDLHASVLDKREANPLLETQHRIYVLADIQELLYQNENMNQIPFHKYVAKFVSNFVESEGKNLSINTQADELYLNVNQAIPLGLLINEILSQFRINPDFMHGITVNLTLRSNPSRKVFLGLHFDHITPAVLTQLTEDYIEATLIDLYTRQLQANSEWVQENEGYTFKLEFMKSEQQKGAASSWQDFSVS